MAYNLPTDLETEVDQVYIYRFLSVIFSVKDISDSNEEEVYEVFISIGQSICDNLSTLLDNHLEVEDCEEEKKLREALKLPDKAGDASSWIYDLVKAMVVLREACRNLRSSRLEMETLTENDESFLQELLHYQYLSNILYELIMCYGDDELRMNGYKYVEEDLKRGVKNWGKFQDDLKEKDWWEYCCNSSEVLNSPSVLYKRDKIGEIYDKLIVFIQTMYYQNKRKSGQEILSGGSSESGSL